MTLAKTPTLTFQNKEGHRFKITWEVITILMQYRQDNTNRLEAGGILLGRYLRGSNNVIVDRTTVPMMGDQRSRHRFYRESSTHQKLLDKAWKESTGTCNYLGEWHTHPEADPFPSMMDIFNWRKRFLIDHIDSDRLYFVIVGTEHIKVWQVYRKWLRIEQLCLCS